MADSRREKLELILGSFIRKEDVQDLADDLGLPVSGTKDALIDRVLDDEDFDPRDALSFLSKVGLQDLCDALHLDPSGTRDRLFDRVLDDIGEESEEEEEGAKPARAAPPSPAYAQQQARAQVPPQQEG